MKYHWHTGISIMFCKLMDEKFHTQNMYIHSCVFVFLPSAVWFSRAWREFKKRVLIVVKSSEIVVFSFYHNIIIIIIIIDNVG